jgi:hypothetical protein
MQRQRIFEIKGNSKGEMKLKFKTKWNAKRGGGLFLGIRLNFWQKELVEDDSNYSWKVSTLDFGLIFFTISIDFCWGKEKFVWAD